MGKFVQLYKCKISHSRRRGGDVKPRCYLFSGKLCLKASRFFSIFRIEIWLPTIIAHATIEAMSEKSPKKDRRFASTIFRRLCRRLSQRWVDSRPPVPPLLIRIIIILGRRLRVRFSPPTIILAPHSTCLLFFPKIWRFWRFYWYF